MCTCSRDFHPPYSHPMYHIPKTSSLYKCVLPKYTVDWEGVQGEIAHMLCNTSAEYMREDLCTQ